MITAILGLIAAITAALISRSVMISNHRQSWINALRDDLAAFFGAIDLIQFKSVERSSGYDDSSTKAEQKARDDGLLTYRKILMRLNMNELLHQQLEKSLETLLMGRGEAPSQDKLAEAVRLARIVLKHEWEVTKYGPFTAPIAQIKSWRKQRAQRN